MRVCIRVYVYACVFLCMKVTDLSGKVCVVEKVDESDASTSQDHGGKESKSKTEGFTGEVDDTCVVPGQTESDAYASRCENNEGNFLEAAPMNENFAEEQQSGNVKKHLRSVTANSTHGYVTCWVYKANLNLRSLSPFFVYIYCLSTEYGRKAPAHKEPQDIAVVQPLTPSTERTSKFQRGRVRKEKPSLRCPAPIPVLARKHDHD